LEKIMNAQAAPLPAPIPAVVLGATGMVGQRFIQLLDGHPWFRVAALTGSARSAGLPYAQACRWLLNSPMPGWAAELPLLPDEAAEAEARLAFSALPAEAAREIEPALARRGMLVCSNASAYRDASDVPLLLPEVNPQHTQLISRQRAERGWDGAIVTNANCTITGLTVVLKALGDRFGLRRAFIVSLQAVSGAGYPGVPAMDILGNVLPYIGGEEEKMEWEPRKMLGRLHEGHIELASVEISAHANRVPVADGHTVCLSVELERPQSLDGTAAALRGYQAPAESRGLPSAPPAPILLRDEPDRPQPRLDLLTGGGMTTVVGRLRRDALFDYKMVILSHNTIRGAAGASIYNAELLVRQGWANGLWS
jgi:aspartate-semialdehyde dehydrogenase